MEAQVDHREQPQLEPRSIISRRDGVRGLFGGFRRGLVQLRNVYLSISMREGGLQG